MHRDFSFLEIFLKYIMILNTCVLVFSLREKYAYAYTYDCYELNCILPPKRYVEVLIPWKQKIGSYYMEIVS